MDSVRKLIPGDEAALMRFLESRPDTTMFLRGNLAAAGVEDHGERLQGTWAAAFEDGEVVAAAGHFWNGNVILEAPRHLEAVLCEAVRRSPRGVQGLVGRHEYVATARALLGLEGAAASLDSVEILYRLELERLVVPAALQEGRVTCRRATLADLPTLAPWGRAYRIESIGMEDGSDLEKALEHGQRASVADGRVWILEEDGTPVAMTAFNARTDDCVQVGGVYTPPELRSRGYARCAVAGSLLDARKDGAERSILFTGEANPSAQACYVGLGYEAIGDYHLLMLREAHDVAL